MKTVEIDSQSGFCGGVIRAISTAEEYLKVHGGRVYSLGAIVHNEEELSRLEAGGIVAIDKEDLEQIPGAGGETLLIRAHGEPPEVYSKIKGLGFNVIDCTCPVVLKLQQDIRAAYERMKALPEPGQVLIYGKIGHPEVLGLVGQVGPDALVVENVPQLRNLIATGLLDTAKEVELFSQTTMSPVEYGALAEVLRSSLLAPLKVHDTICSLVATRHRRLADFAREHDVVIFVSGRHSSNGKVLCDLCKSVNIRTFHICGPSDLNPAWFRPDDKVGVSGATSTPKWLLERVAAAIENLQ